MWDIISDLFVTANGLFYFKEKLTKLKYIGLIFAFIGIVLLSYAELEEK
jgi:drug/metabolite transporter (DMT)-like permease